MEVLQKYEVVEDIRKSSDNKTLFKKQHQTLVRV